MEQRADHNAESNSDPLGVKPKIDEGPRDPEPRPSHRLCRAIVDQAFNEAVFCHEMAHCQAQDLMSEAVGHFNKAHFQAKRLVLEA
eukprot:5613764-Heterocapsa_arctica.AAC.1